MIRYTAFLIITVLFCSNSQCAMAPALPLAKQKVDLSSLPTLNRSKLVTAREKELIASKRPTVAQVDKLPKNKFKFQKAVKKLGTVTHHTLELFEHCFVHERFNVVADYGKALYSVYPAQNHALSLPALSKKYQTRRKYERPVEKPFCLLRIIMRPEYVAYTQIIEKAARKHIASKGIAEADIQVNYYLVQPFL